MKKLNYNFYNRKSEVVARELLGKYLSFNSGGKKLIGKIVETEAYHQNDPASHSYNGPTPRSQIMFGPPGFAYVYFIYGMYHCFNVVTEPKGCGGAVLIRALKPVAGLEIMQENRKQTKLKNLTNGPGKLTQAFGITKKHNGADLVKSTLTICQNGSKRPDIVTTTRIGLSKAENKQLRFYIKDNEFVSIK
jgi:DNA-3-methyladenine glycosylase